MHLVYSQKSLSAQTKRTLAQTLTLCDRSLAVESRSPITETSPEIKHCAFSPNGKLQALFRVVPKKESGERKVIEIVQVDEGRKIAEVDVTKNHGDWYFDREPIPFRFDLRTATLTLDYSHIRASDLAQRLVRSGLHRRSARSRTTQSGGKLETTTTTTTVCEKV